MSTDYCKCTVSLRQMYVCLRSITLSFNVSQNGRSCILHSFSHGCWELDACLAMQCFPDKARAKITQSRYNFELIYILRHTTSRVRLQHTLDSLAQKDKQIEQCFLSWLQLLTMTDTMPVPSSQLNNQF